MGWFDNLDSELDDQPGPSGYRSADAQVNETLVESIQKENDPRNTENQVIQAGKVIDTDQQSEDMGEPKKKTPVQIFIERVTIAGLLEACTAERHWERKLFRLALALAFATILYDSVAIANQYKRESTIFVDVERPERAPFPNVTICFAPTLNETMLKKWLQSATIERTNEILNSNFSTDDVVGFIRKAFLLEVTADILKTNRYATLKKLFRLTSTEKFPTGQFMIPSCSNILSNCTFGNSKFDCCRNAQFLTMWQYSCFQLSMENQEMEDNTDPPSVEKVGLTFDVQTDWTFGSFEDGSASDGYHLFIDELPGQLGVPVPIPANMDALVTLAQPKRFEEITHCYVNDRPRKLKIFSSYDSKGYQCVFEEASDLMFSLIGNCRMPGLSYFPEEDICSLDQIVMMYVAVTDKYTFSNTDDSLSIVDESRLTKMVAKLYKSYTKLGSDDSPCRPLCSRWVHSVFSTGYGSIQYRDEDEEKRQLADRSWSRVRIILPYSTSMLHEERRLSRFYLALSDIGCMMGVYAGFSMITFVQVGFYAGHILWWIREKRRKMAETIRQYATRQVGRRNAVLEIHTGQVEETQL